MTNGAKFFSPDYGLMASKAARAVADAGPILVDPDDRFWTYADGVWSISRKIVQKRTVELLGDRYRPQHLRSIEDVLASQVQQFEAAPISALINFRNGLLRWAGEDGPALLEHHDAVLSTVQLPIEWNPDATCEQFDAFLAASVPADDLERVWEIIGYLMMSGNPLQRLFLLTGGGGNGKGVLLEVVKALLGKNNIAAVPLREFSEDRFATAELFGKLANICGDIDASYIENTGRIKELSGDDDMKAQRKFGQPFNFIFWGKAIFSANSLPASSDSSRGWLRRWEVVDFPNEPTKPVRGLGAMLSTEESLQGVAVKAVQALRTLMDRGTFERGQSAIEVHKAFANRSNRVLTWIDETCELGTPEQWYDRQDIVRAFRLWERFQNPDGKAMNTSQFYELLRQIPGMREAKIQGTRGFYGLTLPGKKVPAPWLVADQGAIGPEQPKLSDGGMGAALLN